MSKVALRALCLLVVFAGACAPKSVAPPVVSSSPKFPEFLRPAVPAAMAGSAAAQGEGRGWALLQAGDLKSAERELLAVLKSAPDFFPAQTVLGYVELARKDPKAALPHFDRTLEQQSADPSALVGRGQANLALGREAEALLAFEAAVAADPSLTEIARRVEVLQFRGLEQGLSAARDAARDGRLDDAIRAYERAIMSSPESAFLYRELAAVERRKGDAEPAIAHLRQAVALDATDAASLAQIGEILDARGDLEGAAKAYADALAIEPSAPLQAKLEAVNARLELARLPAEYRAIDSAPQVTRGDLAALIGVRLAPLLQTNLRGDAVVITDLRTHWAATWIMMVARAGVMDPFDNHAFQPRMVVRRIDLAQAVGRLLARVATSNPARAKAWEGARGRFSDLATGNLVFPAASAAVAAGVLTVDANGRFQPTRAVTGADAVEAIRRMEALADVRSPDNVRR